MPTPSSSPLRAGIIGCGRIAGAIEDEARGGPGFFALPYGHAPAYRLASGVELVAAADPQPGAAQAFAERWGVPVAFGSLDEMLAAEPLDIVSVCAPSRFHAEIFQRLAAQPGLRGVYLEKPVAWSLAEGRAMSEAARGSGLKVVVNHTRTFDPVWRQVKAILDAGRIGTVRALQVRWVEGWSFGGSHLFDLVRSLIGAHPVRVYAETDDDPRTDAGGVAQLLYDNGVRMTVMLLGDVRGTEVSILGTEGRVVVDGQGPRLYTTGHAGVEVQEPFPATMYWTSGMVAAIEELVAAIQTDAPVSSGLDDGVSALEIAVALNMSSESGAPVTLPVGDLAWTVPAV